MWKVEKWEITRVAGERVGKYSFQGLKRKAAIGKQGGVICGGRLGVRHEKKPQVGGGFSGEKEPEKTINAVGKGQCVAKKTPPNNQAGTKGFPKKEGGGATKGSEDNTMAPFKS